MISVKELRFLTKRPAFTQAWKGTKTDPGWPECGIQIFGTKDVSLMSYDDCSSLDNASFQGYTYTRQHYCPNGRWDDWVKLAETILEVNKIVEARRNADYLVESLG